MPRLVDRLPDGPLDLIGDVHGELEALLALLGRLGVEPERRRAQRPLVFVGDLIDRGPDSVGVVQLFAHLADAGLAVAVAGNHELNLLCGEPKEGNGWFFGQPDGAWIDGHHHPFASRPADAADRAFLRAWLGALPLALRRDDLQVVHACWDEAAIAALPASGELAALSAGYAAAIDEDLRRRGIPEQAQAERAAFAGLRDPRCVPDRHLSAVAIEDVAQQRDNPVKLLTSGAEVEVGPGDHFYVGGKWRFVTRDRWWRRREGRPTVVGHYWRRRGAPIPGKVDLWDDVGPFDWSGGVTCVDYSVGRRYAERLRGRAAPFDGGLAALRWPEQVVVFDDCDGAVPMRA